MPHTYFDVPNQSILEVTHSRRRISKKLALQIVIEMDVLRVLEMLKHKGAEQ